MPLSSPAVDGVRDVLMNDAQLLAFKNLTPTSNIADRANYVMDTEETDVTIDASAIPVILVYTRPGKTGAHTIQMYMDKVVIDVYAADAYHARLIADRVYDLLHNADLPMYGFQVSSCRLAYATTFRTALSGVRGHRIWFDVSYYTG